MSQVNQPGITMAPRVGSARTVWVALVVALVLGAGLVLALTLSDGSDSTSPAKGTSAQAASRPDGGPSESSIAAAVGTHAAVGPQESQIAASLRDRPVRFSTGPDESRVATSISSRPQR